EIARQQNVVLHVQRGRVSGSLESAQERLHRVRPAVPDDERTGQPAEQIIDESSALATRADDDYSLSHHSLRSSVEVDRVRGNRPSQSFSNSCLTWCWCTASSSGCFEN